MRKYISGVLVSMVLLAGCASGGLFSGTSEYSGGNFVLANSADGIELRQAPAISAPVIAVLKQGEYGEIISADETPDVVQGEQGVWVQIKYGENTGYAFDAFFERVMRIVKPLSQQFDIEGEVFHESMDCHGVTYSEYAGTLEFDNGVVTMKRTGASSLPCTPKPGSEPAGYYGVYESVTTGTYTVTREGVVAIFTKLTVVETPDSELCSDANEKKVTKTMQRRVVFNPVLCRDAKNEVKALRAFPFDGNDEEVIWVTK